MTRGVTRRTFLLGVLAAGACSSRRSTTPDRVALTTPSPHAPSPPAPPPAPPTTPAPIASATATPPAPPPPAAFEPLPGDVLPEAKRLAGRIAVALVTYQAGELPAAVAARALGAASPAETATAASASAAADVLAGALGPLVVAGARSTGEVVYPQLGGETAERCSVMVVTRQTLTTPEAAPLAVVTRTIDVRLRLAGAAWTFEELASVGGDPVPTPSDLSEPARLVLADPRIELPDSARWDIAARRVSDRLLETLLVMAEQAPFSATVLSSGHPLTVFGTDRPTDHLAGRAVDVWRVGGAAVVGQAGDGPAGTMARALFESGTLKQLGAPWDYDAGGGSSFTDRVHTDHLHVAVPA